MTRRIITSQDLEAVVPARPRSPRPVAASEVRASTELPAIGGAPAARPRPSTPEPAGSRSAPAPADDGAEPVVTLRSLAAVPAAPRGASRPPRRAESSATLRAVAAPRPPDTPPRTQPPVPPAPAGASGQRFERLPASLAASVVDASREQQRRGQAASWRGRTALVASLAAIVAGGLGVFVGQSTRATDEQIQERIDFAVSSALAEERAAAEARLDKAVRRAIRRANRR